MNIIIIRPFMDQEDVSLDHDDAFFNALDLSGYIFANIVCW